MFVTLQPRLQAGTVRLVLHDDDGAFSSSRRMRADAERCRPASLSRFSSAGGEEDKASTVSPLAPILVGGTISRPSARSMAL